MGVRFFMVLAAMGEAGMTAYIERQFDLTAQTYDYLQNEPDFYCPVAPQSNILCFRIKGVHDEGQLALRDRLLAKGSYYISTATLDNVRYLRLTLTNPSTTLDDIKGLVDEIRRLISAQ